MITTISQRYWFMLFVYALALLATGSVVAIPNSVHVYNVTPQTTTTTVAAPPPTTNVENGEPSAIQKQRATDLGLMPRYGLRMPSMVLLLHMEGSLSAHSLESGKQMWNLDTGGSVVHARYEQHPTDKVLKTDPFSQPFLMEGGMLFTRRRFTDHLPNRRLPVKPGDNEDFERSDAGNADNDGDGEENVSNLPLTPLHPNYFMNLSTLIRRRHVHVRGTDIFVTTSARLMDVNGHSGEPLRTTSTSSPYLHVVRYNTTIHVQCLGEYSWQMSLSQYKLKERSPSRPSESPSEDADPTYLSRLLQKWLQSKNPNKELGLSASPEVIIGGAENFKPILKANHKNTLSDVLSVREVGLKKYVLWNNRAGSSLWPNGVISLNGLAAAYVWIVNQGGLQRIPVYPLLPSSCTTNCKGTSCDSNNATVTTGVTLIDGGTEATAKGGNGHFTTTRVVDNRQCSEESSVGFFLSDSLEYDIDAEERENRELHDSLQQCSWFYGYNGPYSPLLNQSLMGANQSMEMFQLLSTVSLLWSYHVTRRAAFIGFHVLCFIVSFTLLSLGVVLRPRLRNAWAHSDALRNKVRNSSRACSGQLIPVDMRTNGDVEGIVDASRGVTPSAVNKMNGNIASSIPSLSLDGTASRTDMVAGTSTDQKDSTYEWRRSCGDSSDVSGGQKSDELIVQKGNSPPQLFQQHFEVIEKIGHGAEGSVYRVKHKVTETLYAIKAVCILPNAQKRHVREAILHSSLDCPNVVRFFYSWIEDIPRDVALTHGIIHDADVTDSFSTSGKDESTYDMYINSSSSGGCFYKVLFIQMEYFQRGTLADYLRDRKQFTRSENLDYLVQIAEGLSYLHRQFIVHRDLKPTNIFLSDSGIVKIGDFGLAKRHVLQSNSITNGIHPKSPFFLGDEKGSIAGGTPLYCSPEQLCGNTATAASDIYSLGVIALEFYSLFTTMHERLRTLEGARRGELPPSLVDNFPEEGELIRSMLREQKEDRPTLDNVLQQLQALLFTASEKKHLEGNNK